MDLNRCIMCGNVTKTRCSDCKGAYYCSTKCQKADRPLHRLLCKKFIPFLGTRPAHEPGKDGSVTDLGFRHIVAILLPVTKTEPELIWLKCRSAKESDEEPAYQEVNTGVRDYLNPQLGSNGEAAFQDRFGRGIEIWMGMHCFGHDQEPANLCVNTLNQGYESVDRSLSTFEASVACGNNVITSVICSNDQNGAEIITYQDATPADLRHGFYYYSCNNNIFESDEPNPYFLREEDEWVKGVIISCTGDMHYLGKKKYREVALHRLHEIFNKDPANKSPICHHMDIPVVVKELSFSPLWARNIKKGMSFDPCKNHVANLLMIKAETTGFDWVCPMNGWDTSVEHSVLVALSNFEDITTLQVEGLVSYLRDIETVMEGNGELMSTKWREQFLVDHFQSKKFEEHMDLLRVEKIKSGDNSWAYVGPLRGDWTGQFSQLSDGLYIASGDTDNEIEDEEPERQNDDDSKGGEKNEHGDDKETAQETAD